MSKVNINPVQELLEKGIEPKQMVQIMDEAIFDLVLYKLHDTEICTNAHDAHRVYWLRQMQKAIEETYTIKNE